MHPFDSLWQRDRLRGVPSHPALAGYCSKRTLASAGWTLGQRYREMLRGMKAYWYQFPAVALGNFQTLESRIVTTSGFYLVAIMARASIVTALTGSFRADIYDSGDRYKLFDRGANQLDAFPIAQEQMILKKPHYIAPGSPLLATIRNMDGSGVANTVRIALFGYVAPVGSVVPRRALAPTPTAAELQGAGMYKEPFDETGAVALPAVLTAANVVSFQVPQGRNGIIQRIANQVIGGGWTDGSGALNFQILRDGVAVRNYNNILSSLGTPAIPSQVDGIEILENEVITLVINNVTLVGAGIMAVGRLGGYFYPKQYGQNVGTL